MFLKADISIAYRRTTITAPRPLYAWLIDCLTLPMCRGLGWKRHVVLVTHLSVYTLPCEGPCRGKRQRYVRIYTNSHIYTPQTHTHTHTPPAPKTPIWRVPFRPLRTDQAQLWLERSQGLVGSDWADSERAQRRVTGHSQQPWRCERSWVIVSPRCVGRVGFQKATGASERHRFIDTELSPGPLPEVITQNMSMSVEAWPPYFISTLSPCRLK